MTIEQARNILITFNRWRRGEDVEPMLEPSDIGKAIDVAIYLLEEKNTLIDPNTVNYNPYEDKC